MYHSGVVKKTKQTNKKKPLVLQEKANWALTYALLLQSFTVYMNEYTNVALLLYNDQGSS